MTNAPLILSFSIVGLVFLVMLLDPPIRRLRRKRTEALAQERVQAKTKTWLVSHFRSHVGSLGNWYDRRQFQCHLNKLFSHYEAFKSSNDRSLTPEQFLLRQARSLKQLLDRRIIAAELECFATTYSCNVPQDELDQFLLDVTDHNRPFVDSVDLALSIRRKLEQARPVSNKPAAKQRNSILDAYQSERSQQENALKKILSPNAGLSQLNAELDRHMNEWMYQHAGGKS